MNGSECFRKWAQAGNCRFSKHSTSERRRNRCNQKRSRSENKCLRKFATRGAQLRNGTSLLLDHQGRASSHSRLSLNLDPRLRRVTQWRMWSSARLQLRSSPAMVLSQTPTEEQDFSLSFGVWPAYRYQRTRSAAKGNA